MNIAAEAVHHPSKVRRRRLDLPEFLLCALEHRLAEVNEDATPEEAVSLENLIEIDLANSLSLADVAHLERDLPGIGAAVSRWLDEIE